MNRAAEPPAASNVRGSARRVRVLLALLLTGLFVIAGRLSYLQLLRGPEYAALGRANAVQSERVTPLRGRILARDGTVLAENRVAVDLLYRGGEVARWPRLRFLLGLTGEPRAPDPNRPDEAQGAVLAWNLPDETVAATAELIAGQPNLFLRRRLERTYPTGLAAHAVGTTTEADPGRFTGYGLGDLVGQTGVEKTFQSELFGLPGRALLNVDSRRGALGRTVVTAAEPGRDVVLTLDVEVQRLAERTLGGALRYVNAERRRQGRPPATTLRGALVAMDPPTGEILALASAPTFDPNVFVRHPVAEATVGALLQGRAAPLTNRAVSAYPPASTFKVVSSLALLDGGTLTPETRLDCSPSFTFQGTLMRNWSAEPKGPYTVVQALADSCNTFFWRAASRTPGVTEGWGSFAERLARTARALGYGAPVGVGVPERPGRVPDEGWARSVYAHAWYPGFTMNMTVGQGDLLATPVQVLQLVGTVALGGEQVQPHLVRSVGGVPTEVSVRSVPGAWRVVQAGMRAMVTDYGGRGFLGPDVFEVAVAGKTGTAENSGSDHAWFMGYGPLTDPELAVVVFIENGGPSSAVAQPVARDFMRAYWSRSKLAADD